MRTKLLGALALVSLVALAGCSLPGNEEMEHDFGPDQLTAEDAAEQHMSALEDAGSFSAEAAAQYNTTSENAFVGNTTFTQTGAIDSGANRSWLQTEYYGTTTERFSTGSATYVKSATGSNTTYGMDEPPYNGSIEPTDMNSLAGEPKLSGDLAGTLLVKDGYTTYNGEPVAIYTADDAGVVLSNLEESSNADLESGSVTLYMNQDGVFVYMETSYEGEVQGDWMQVTTERSVSDIGATTVDDPTWLETAQNETSE